MTILSNGEYRPGPPTREQRAAAAIPDAWMREAQLTDRVTRAEEALRLAVESGDTDARLRAQMALQVAEAQLQAATGLVEGLEDAAKPIEKARGRG